METLNNLNKISTFFFFVLAGLYVGMVLLMRKGFEAETLMNLMRLLDMPAAFISLLYGGSTLSLHISQTKESLSPWVMVIATICVGLLAAFVVIQVTVPGQI